MLLLTCKTSSLNPIVILLNTKQKSFLKYLFEFHSKNCTRIKLCIPIDQHIVVQSITNVKQKNIRLPIAIMPFVKMPNLRTSLSWKLQTSNVIVVDAGDSPAPSTDVGNTAGCCHLLLNENNTHFKDQFKLRNILFWLNKIC